MIVAPLRSLGAAALLAALALTGCSTGLHHLAIANGNLLRVIDADSGRSVTDVTRYQEVTRLGYRPDGERLAVRGGLCGLECPVAE